jgi:type IV pilus assembly protein PilA
MTSLNSKLQLAVLNRKKGRNLLEKGFTLVELMIVIVIVGILSSVALPNFLSQSNKARAIEGKMQVATILKQAGSLYVETGAITTANCTEIDTTLIGALNSGALSGKYTLSSDCAANQAIMTVTATGANDNYPGGTGAITYATGVTAFTGWQ